MSRYFDLLGVVAERFPASQRGRKAQPRRIKHGRVLRYESLEGRRLLAVMPGDFNTDGIVDTADFVAWRNSDGTQAGYSAWRTNLGTASIQLNGTSIDVGKSGATAVGQMLTITSAGTYQLSGTLTNGQIIVNTADSGAVKLILDGVNITCSNNPAVYVMQADDVVITLSAGTQNYLTDGAAYPNAVGTDPDAAVFSDSDLTINGAGTLTVDANFNNGITSKDDLVIESGTIMVDAVNDAIRGRDSVEIKGGTITVTAGGDGVQSNNDEDPAKGFVIISGGTFNVTSVGDGVQAETTLLVSGGSTTILAAGGSTSTALTGKGLKAGGDITIQTGTVQVNSSDDAITSNTKVKISGGTLTLATTDDAIHGETNVDITGGNITITASYEGIDGAAITINNATIQVVATNDGITAASATGLTSTIVINGGTITIKSGSDGIQAEASVQITNGIFNITTAGGSAYTVPSTQTAKGIKSDAALAISGGTFTLNVAEDAIHANVSITISGGTFTISASDDAIHADATLTISNGDINITKSYEGIESSRITISGGTIHIVSSDDGINASQGTSNRLDINGGYVYVNAAGDGIDINGSGAMTAGTVIVFGPTANNNAAFDYDGTFLQSGGFLIAVGSAGMAQKPSAGSTQKALLYNFGSAQAAGTLINIQSTSGTPIATFVAAKSFQSVVVSSPLLTVGSYRVYRSGSSTGTLKDGLYTGGVYTPGTLAATINVT